MIGKDIRPKVRSVALVVNVARFLVVAIGSLGDLHPMMPVAIELQRRGHQVSFAAPPVLHSELVMQGFECVRLPPLVLPGPGTSGDSTQPKFLELAGPHLESIIDKLDEACEGVDAVLTSPHQVASAIVAERRRIPWITLTVFPGFIPSSYTVPEPHWLPALPTPVGRVVNRLTWRAYRQALLYINRDYINRAVESRGLKFDHNLYAPGVTSPHLTLVLSSAHYTPPLRDWPASVKVSGYSPWDRPRHWTEPHDLAAFLAGGPPPVVVTVSSARNGGLLLTIAKQALEESGRRGILLTGQASEELLGGAPHLILDRGIAAFPYIPLSYLLPKADLVIHHAGIGTVLTTAMHGLPCIAIPTSFDHFYNAGRVRALGIGRVLPGNVEVVDRNARYRHVTAHKLAEEIVALTADPGYRHKARELMTAMKGEDGPGRAGDEIEALLARRRAGRPAAASA